MVVCYTILLDWVSFLLLFTLKVDTFSPWPDCEEGDKWDMVPPKYKSLSYTQPLLSLSSHFLGPWPCLGGTVSPQKPLSRGDLQHNKDQVDFNTLPFIFTFWHSWFWMIYRTVYLLWLINVNIAYLTSSRSEVMELV